MAARQLRNPNHPRKGAAIKVQPIRSVDDIAKIKAHLRPHPRNYCLFVLGINTAFRSCELASLKIGQVAHLRAGDRLEVKQSKNQRYRAAILNSAAYEALQYWLAHHPYIDSPNAALFRSYRGRVPIRANTITALVKAWCREIGLSGNFGSHSLRKTWGFHQRKTHNQPIALLMKAYGHSSERQTLNYLCIDDEEIDELYFGEV